MNTNPTDCARAELDRVTAAVRADARYEHGVEGSFRRVAVLLFGHDTSELAESCEGTVWVRDPGKTTFVRSYLPEQVPATVARLAALAPSEGATGHTLETFAPKAFGRHLATLEALAVDETADPDERAQAIGRLAGRAAIKSGATSEEATAADLAATKAFLASLAPAQTITTQSGHVLTVIATFTRPAGISTMRSSGTTFEPKHREACALAVAIDPEDPQRSEGVFDVTRGTTGVRSFGNHYATGRGINQALAILFFDDETREGTEAWTRKILHDNEMKARMGDAAYARMLRETGDAGGDESV